MELELLRKVEEVIGMKWEDFKAEHPNQAANIEAVYGVDFKSRIMQTLQADERYKELIDKTEREASIVELVKVIGPIVFDTILKFI